MGNLNKNEFYPRADHRIKLTKIEVVKEVCFHPAFTGQNAGMKLPLSQGEFRSNNNLTFILRNIFTLEVDQKSPNTQIMLQSILEAVVDEVGESFTKNAGMDAREAEESLELTGQTALEVITQHMGAGGMSSLMNLFSERRANGVEADAIQNEITAKVTNSLLQKNNFNLQKVLPIVTMVLPMVMNQISKRNDTTPDDDDSPLQDMFGNAAGGLVTGAMGGLLKKFF